MPEFWRDIADGWTVFAIAALTTMAVYPAVKAGETVRPFAVGWLALLVALFVVGGQFLFRFTLRPFSARLRLGYMSRPAWTGLMILGGGIGLGAVLARASGPLYSLTGNFALSAVVGEGAAYALFLAPVYIAGKMVVLAGRGLLGDGGAIAAVKAPYPGPQYYQSYVSGDELYALAADRTISRRRLLGIRLGVVALAVSGMTGTGGTGVNGAAQIVGFLFGLTLVYYVALRGLSKAATDVDTTQQQSSEGGSDQNTAVETTQSLNLDADEGDIVLDDELPEDVEPREHPALEQADSTGRRWEVHDS